MKIRATKKRHKSTSLKWEDNTVFTTQILQSIQALSSLIDLDDSGKNLLYKEDQKGDKVHWAKQVTE